MLSFGNVLNGNCCLMTRKRPKAKGKMSPKMSKMSPKTRKWKEQGERKEEKKKKSNGCALSFYVDFFERN